MVHILASASYSDARAEGRAIEFLSWLRNFDINLDDVNPKTGLTPLHRAVMSDNRGFALALVENGASVTITTAKERRSPADMARDDTFRQELLGRGKAAAAVVAKMAGAPVAARSFSGSAASSGPAHKIIATPDAPLAALAEAARGAFAAASAHPVPYVGAPLSHDEASGSGANRTLLTAAANPVLLPDAAQPAPRAEADDDARPRRLRRRLVTPEASAAASLRDAWWRARERFPPAPAPIPRSEAVAQLAYRGIPAELRADVWLAAAGVPAVMCGLSQQSLPSLCDDAGGGSEEAVGAALGRASAGDEAARPRSSAHVEGSDATRR